MKAETTTEQKTIYIRCNTTDAQQFDDYCKSYPNKQQAFNALIAQALAQPPSTTEPTATPAVASNQTNIIDAIATAGVNEVDDKDWDKFIKNAGPLLANKPTIEYVVLLLPNNLIVRLTDGSKLFIDACKKAIIEDDYLPAYSLNEDDFVSALVNKTIYETMRKKFKKEFEVLKNKNFSNVSLDGVPQVEPKQVQLTATRVYLDDNEVLIQLNTTVRNLIIGLRWAIVKQNFIDIDISQSVEYMNAIVNKCIRTEMADEFSSSLRRADLSY